MCNLKWIKKNKLKYSEFSLRHDKIVKQTLNPRLILCISWAPPAMPQILNKNKSLCVFHFSGWRHNTFHIKVGCKNWEIIFLKLSFSFLVALSLISGANFSHLNYKTLKVKEKIIIKPLQRKVLHFLLAIAVEFHSTYEELYSVSKCVVLFYYKTCGFMKTCLGIPRKPQNFNY